MTSHADARDFPSPGNYVSFLLANADQELSQLVENYISVGQYEAARFALLQLLDLNPTKAQDLVYRLINLSPSTVRTTSIPSSAHLTWILTTEYAAMGTHGKQIARELLQTTEFEMILSDLEELSLLTAANRAELSRLLKTPLTASFSASLRQQLASVFSSYPILATTLCTILSTRCQQVGNMELSKAMWGPFVAQILDDKSSPVEHQASDDLIPPNARLHLLQHLTFTAQSEPSNASGVFSALVALYFTPSMTKSYTNSFGNPVRQKIYSYLLALPGGAQAYALQLYSNIEEAAVRRECERQTSELAWPFEILRPIAVNRRQSLLTASSTSEDDSQASEEPHTAITETERSHRMQEFWAQYFDFVTISKNHFLEYIITQFFELIDQHRFEDCRVLLLPFQQMKPLLLLMCFEKFGNDIKSKQEVLDMLWNEEQDKSEGRAKAAKNQILNDAVNTIAYQVNLARWAGALLLKQHATEIENGQPKGLVIGNERAEVPRDEPDFAISNLIANLLKQHGILFILHHYLRNVDLEDLERIIKQTPISADESAASAQSAQLATDLTLLYCYFVLKEVVGQIQAASEGKTSVDASSIVKIETVLSKLESPSVLLSLLETVFNFLFMRTDAWENPGVRVLVSNSRRGGGMVENIVAPSFVVGPELSFALVSLISKSSESLKLRQDSMDEVDVERLELFDQKLTEVRWRLNLIKSRPYFLTPLLSLNGSASPSERTESNSSVDHTAQGNSSATAPTTISVVSLLIAKPEALLIRTIRERDFDSAHAIVEFFKMDQRNAEGENLDVDGLSMGASHLAKVSELVFTIRRDLTAGKPINAIIDPIIKNSDEKPADGSQRPPISKLEVFFLLCDMAMTSNLPSDQTSKLLDSAQALCDDIKSKLSAEDADHFVDYMDRLRTLDKAEALSEALPTLRAGILEGTSVESPISGLGSNGNASAGYGAQNTTNMSWIPNGLNARLLALESWPTESDALGGYLQLRSRLLGAVSKLRTIVSQSVTSREKGFSAPAGLDSEDTLRKLTLFLSVDDWTPTQQTTPGSPTSTPAKSMPMSAARTPSGNSGNVPSSPYRTPSGASTVAPSPSTRAKSAFNSLGDGFLQAFLRQLLMLGVSLRDDARLGRTDFFEHLHAAPKHILAELVYGSRNYNMAESIAGELELDLVALILELMGTIKPSRMQRSTAAPDSAFAPSTGSSSSLGGGLSTPVQHRNGRKGLNSSALTPNSDLALDYMPSVGYGSNLSYEYGMNTGAASGGHDSYGDKYTLHLNLVEYLKSHSPLVATLACILRAPSDKYDERFLSYALSSTKRHFAPLHLWLRVKVRQFGVFYNTTLRDQPDEISYPIGPSFVQSSKSSSNAHSNGGAHQSGDITGTSLTSSAMPTLSSSQTSQTSLTGHSLTQQQPMQKWHANRATALSASSSLIPSAASSFDPGFEPNSFGARGRSGISGHGSFRADHLSTSFASSVGSMGSGLGLGGNASPTSSMNELGIDGGLQNNAMLAARAQQRRTNVNSSQSNLMRDPSSHTHHSSSATSRFSDDEDDEPKRRLIGDNDDDDRENDDEDHDGQSKMSLSVGAPGSSVGGSGASPRSPAMRIKTSSGLSAAGSVSSSLASSRPEFSLKHDVELGNGLAMASNLHAQENADGLCLKYPTIDILDASEAQIFEQIFQNENLQAEVAMYAKAVEKLEKTGHFQKALELADAALPTGAPDSLLRKLIDSTQDKQLAAEYLLRMSNKTEAAQLALALVPHWEIPTIMQVLFMCDCHLSKEAALMEVQASPKSAKNDDATAKQKTDISTALSKVRDMYERVQRYSEILDVVKDDVQSRWKSWLELDELARKDLAVVVHMLLNGGHYEIARRLTEHFKHTFLKLRVEEKYLLHLLELGDTRGVRMRLRSLEGEEAVRIAQSLMDLVSTNDDRLFLTQFILERKAQQSKMLSEVSNASGGASGASSSELNTLTATELGLKILLCLPPELQKVFQPLMSSPFVIIESLLVSEQTLVLNKLFKEIPQVHDDQLVLKYARKALDATRLFSAADAVLMSRSPSNSSMRDSYPGANITPSSTAPHSRTVSDDESTPPQTIGYFDPHESASGPAPYGGLSRYGISQAATSVTGANMPHTPAKKLYLADEKKEHTYASAPNYPLAAGILDLCRNANLVAATCIEISDQLSARLHSIKDRLFVVRVIQQLLYYAKLRLMTSDFSTLDLVQTCDMLLQRTELLLQLIFCGGTASASAIAELSKSLSLSMLADTQKSRSLRERLIENDLLDLALLVATKCGVETDPVWAAKALRMLETNRYQEAKQLFRYCLVSIYPEEQNDEGAQQPNRSSGGLNATTKTVSDNSFLLSKILSILETNVPIETEKLAQRRDYLTSLVRPPHNASAIIQKDSLAWHKRFKNMEDIDEGDAAQRSLEALRKTSTGATANAQAAAPIIVRRHTLDSIRYMQCIYYLQRFGSEEMIIKFWLRHDLLEDCLRHMDSKPPPFDTKLLLLVVNHALSRNIFGRFRDALYKIDKDVERWREAMLAICVHFHKSNMPTVLLELQIVMKDYSRAGLTSMTIYNSQSDPHARIYYLELVQRYLTVALEHYEETLSIQQKSTSSTSRLPLTKVDIAKHIKTAGLQAKLIEFSLTLEPSKANPSPDVLPEEASLWGNTAAKNQVTEFLIVNHNFELAFKVIQEYRLASDKIYRDAVVKMAKKKQAKKIEELLKSIKIVLSGRDIDACNVAVARVYGMVHSDFSTAETFAAKVFDQPLACEALIACRKLKQAYLIAAKLKDLDLVRAIQAEAKRLDMKREYELCDAFLKSYDESYQ